MMSKEEALNKIKELQDYISDIDSELETRNVLSHSLMIEQLDGRTVVAVDKTDELMSDGGHAGARFYNTYKYYWDVQYNGKNISLVIKKK